MDTMAAQTYAPHPPDPVKPPAKDFRDPASHSQPGKHFTRHIHLELTIDHNAKKISGTVTYKIDVLDPTAAELILDIRRINVHSVKGPDPLPFVVTEDVSPVGGTLAIKLPSEDSSTFTISFDTDGRGTGSPGGGACDWLSEDITGDRPFVFTQAQAIHARSIFPCQDTPAVKAPYSAVISVAQPHSDLTVVMSAQRVSSRPEDPAGSSRFECAVPIPSYLFAFACGSLSSRDLSPRSRVWALPDVVEKAAWEFEEVEKMLSTAEAIAGPYVWGRYDLLVLPPSFPYGGMENPMLTFVTPTLLSGDRSLVSVIVHEIAHSWTGNLLSCQDCGHFWMNEGFTVKLERRILRELYGTGREGLDAVAGQQTLNAFVKSVGEEHKYTSLVAKLQDGEDPDDYFSCVAYEKGYNLLLLLEQYVQADYGSDFHEFLKEYFNLYKYQSITSSDFVNLFQKKFPMTSNKVDFENWLHGVGGCPELPKLDTSLVEEASALAKEWVKCFTELQNESLENGIEKLTDKFDGKVFTEWDPKQKLCFLNELKANVSEGETKRADVVWNHRCAELLQHRYDLDNTRNSEIRFVWYRLGLLAGYAKVLDKVKDFLTEQGRMKFVRPLFSDLYHTFPKGDYAATLFSKLRGKYHSICVKMIERDLATEQ